MYKWFLFSLMLLCANISIAQTSKEKLASEYLGNKEFDKAAEIYQDLLDGDPASFYYYDNLLSCFIGLNQWDKAIKLSKKQEKKFPDMPQFVADEIWLLNASGKTEEVSGIKSKVMAKHGKAPDWMEAYANALMRRSLYQEALETYLFIRKQTGDEKVYALDVARLYDVTGNWKAMYQEAISAVANAAENLEAMQGLLQEHMSDSLQRETFKLMLADALKKSPGNESLTDLMIWYFTQTRSFYQAFYQLKLLDKKQGGDGHRILEMAEIALSNGYTGEALDMFQYVADLGESSIYSANGAFGVLKVRKQKIEEGNYDSTDVTALEVDYLELIKKGLGTDQQIASAKCDLARLEAFYLHHDSLAIAILTDLIKPGQHLSNAFIDECKLLLGDIYLFIGDYWEPVLLYGQVEKDMKEDPLGQEAKFRNARLSYFKGDFQWAEGQLSVLKTATSQLMANNAMELSLLIIENTGLDSNVFPLERFAAADLLIYQNRFSDANKLLDSLYTAFPFHSLCDDILYAKSRIARKTRQYADALVYLDKIVSIYGDDVLADNALWDAAQIEEINLANPQKAKVLYEQLITSYPGSLFTVEARKRFRALRGDTMPVPGP